MDPIKVHAVADHVIVSAYNKNSFLCSAKLQRLLYFIQGWYLAFFDGQPLFDDDFEAWKHGPVVPALYVRFADLISPLLMPLDLEDLFFKSVKRYKPLLNASDTAHVELLFDTYGDLSVYQLEEVIKAQPPWKKSRSGLAPYENGNSIIPKYDIYAYFSALMS